MRPGKAAALTGLVLAVAAALVVEGAALAGPWLAVEEADALVAARGVRAPWHATGFLYPALIAPAARVLDAADAYAFAKALSAVLWALSAVPAYLLASRLLRPWPALAVALLAVVGPASVYGTAATPDALATLAAVSSLALAARASERGDTRALAAAVALAVAAALTRPWYVVLPAALLVAHARRRESWRSLLAWPRSLALAVALAVAYLLLAPAAPEAAFALADPAELVRSGGASLAAAAVGTAILPWLLAPGFGGSAARPEAALLASALPALALTAALAAAADPARRIDERPLLALAPLVLALGAAALRAGARPRHAAVAALALVAVAAIALPGVGRPPLARAAGLSVVAPDGGSRAFLVAAFASAALVGLLALLVVRRRRALLLAALAPLLLAGQAAAFASVRDEARALAAVEPAPRGWIDAHAGADARVVVVAPPQRLDEPAVAQLEIWNRSVRGTRELDLSSIDPTSGQLPGRPEADVLLVRGTELAGVEVARSPAGTLVREPQIPLRLAKTVEGVFPDGWSGGTAVYRRWSGSTVRGVVAVSLSREAWHGATTAEVAIETGPLYEEGGRRQERLFLPAGVSRAVAVEVPPPPFVVTVTIAPTFPGTDLNPSDARQLGARIRFAYRPAR